MGVGSDSGELIPVPDGRGGTEYLKDISGKLVQSRLDANTLREIARLTGALYVSWMLEGVICNQSMIKAYPLFLKRSEKTTSKKCRMNIILCLCCVDF